MAGHFLAIVINMQYSREILPLPGCSLTELSTVFVDKGISSWTAVCERLVAAGIGG
jgi:hypothetical protein